MAILKIRFVTATAVVAIAIATEVKAAVIASEVADQGHCLVSATVERFAEKPKVALPCQLAVIVSVTEAAAVGFTLEVLKSARGLEAITTAIVEFMLEQGVDSSSHGLKDCHLSPCQRQHSIAAAIRVTKDNL